MADPRAAALMRALGGGGEPMPEEMMEGGEAPTGPEQAAQEALATLEPFIDEPRIAKAAQLLQEVAGGPSEPSEDTMPAEDMPPQPGQ